MFSAGGSLTGLYAYPRCVDASCRVGAEKFLALGAASFLLSFPVGRIVSNFNKR